MASFVLLTVILLTGSFCISAHSAQPVIVLDVDGTLYDDDCLIETQIRDNCHIFSAKFGYSNAQSEEMHKKYGSTIRGICEYGAPRETVMDYYNEVYPGIDMSLLRKYSIFTKQETGYSVEIGEALRSLDKLQFPIVVASNSPVFHVKRVLSRLGLAQLEVAAYLTPERCGGLTKCEPRFWDPIFDLFPKSEYVCTLIDDNGLNVQTVRSIGMQAIQITPQFSLAEAIIYFLDVLPLKNKFKNVAKLFGSKAAGEDWDAEARGRAATKDSKWLNLDAFKFDDSNYLSAKNTVDSEAINPDVKQRLRKELLNHLCRMSSSSTPSSSLSLPQPQSHSGARVAVSLQGHSKQPDKQPWDRKLTVVDLGAGLLNLLQPVGDLFHDVAQEMEPQAAESAAATSADRDRGGARSDKAKAEKPLELVYIAFESNEALYHTTVGRLNSMGLRQLEMSKAWLKEQAEAGAAVEAVTATYLNHLHSVVRTFTGTLAAPNQKNKPSRHTQGSGSGRDINVTVHLVSLDFMSEKALALMCLLAGAGAERRIDLIVGCCVADLLPPEHLAAQVVEMAGDGGGLLYLPITFAGATRLVRKGKAAERIRATSNSNSNSKITTKLSTNSASTGAGVYASSGERVKEEALTIPSDEEVFDLYHSHLRERGHHLDANKLAATLQRYGCSLCLDDEELEFDSRNAQAHITGTSTSTTSTTSSTSTTTTTTATSSTSTSTGSTLTPLQQRASANVNGITAALPRSDWRISLRRHPLMWRCMLRFITLGTTFRALGEELDTDIQGLQGWFQALFQEMDDLLAQPARASLSTAQLKKKQEERLYKRREKKLQHRIEEQALREQGSEGLALAYRTAAEAEAEAEDDEEEYDDEDSDLVLRVRNVDILARLPRVEQSISLRVRAPRGRGGWGVPFGRGQGGQGGQGSEPRVLGSVGPLGSDFGVYTTDELRASPPFYDDTPCGVACDESNDNSVATSSGNSHVGAYGATINSSQSAYDAAKVENVVGTVLATGKGERGQGREKGDKDAAGKSASASAPTASPTAVNDTRSKTPRGACADERRGLLTPGAPETELESTAAAVAAAVEADEVVMPRMSFDAAVAAVAAAEAEEADEACRVLSSLSSYKKSTLLRSIAQPTAAPGNSPFSPSCASSASFPNHAPLQHHSPCQPTHTPTMMPTRRQSEDDSVYSECVRTPYDNAHLHTQAKCAAPPTAAVYAHPTPAPQYSASINAPTSSWEDDEEFLLDSSISASNAVSMGSIDLPLDVGLLQCANDALSSSSSSAAASSAAADLAASAAEEELMLLQQQQQKMCRMVEFTGPRELRVVSEVKPVPGPRQILLRTLCSLVSTGTELKVFAGDMDATQEADLTISGMAGSGLKYPLRYGYSLVGEVEKVGSELSLEDWLGRRFFSFSPHGSVALIDADTAIEVPADVSAEDAAFFPSVETAVSLAMKARPLLGERVAVVGQGLIGLLTGAALRELGGTELWLLDIRQERLAIAEEFVKGAHVWNPAGGAAAGRDRDGTSTPASLPPDFDVTVEVSGSMRGLQTAVDCSATGGRIVLGSWYGEGASPLRLGMKFHRSQIEFVCSQVSHVPGELLPRWTKQRRFHLAWDVLRRIRPSRLLRLQAEEYPGHDATKTGKREGDDKSSTESAEVEADLNFSGADVGAVVKLSSGAEEIRRAYENLAEGKLITVLFRNDD